MVPVNDLPQVFFGDVGVNSGRFEVFVPQHLLDYPDTCPVLKHVPGTGTAQLPVVCISVVMGRAERRVAGV